MDAGLCHDSRRTPMLRAPMTIADAPPVADNAPPYSVSELAFALKRTLEDAYGFVRLRGELSKVTRHASGHVYLTLKDERAAIDGVVWKGQVRGLACQPEQGLEVIVTGRITTYPASSKYQIVIETHGAGRRRRAAGAARAAEGQARGRGPVRARAQAAAARHAGGGRRDHQPDRRGDPRHPAPHPRPLALPGRSSGRWWCRATQAAAQVARRHRRASTPWPPAAPIPRPDVLIVARGGGSVEDLWAVQRRGAGPRGGGQRHPADLGRRARDRHHPDRLRLRPPRADADRRRRDGDAGAGRAEGRRRRPPARG